MFEIFFMLRAWRYILIDIGASGLGYKVLISQSRASQHQYKNITDMAEKLLPSPQKILLKNLKNE
jgi:hypothetical protein